MQVTTQGKKINLRSIVIGFLIAEAIFILDAQLPLGVSDGVLYVVLVLIGYDPVAKGTSSGAPLAEPPLFRSGFSFPLQEVSYGR